jgi:hypothetical protein
LNPHAFRRHPLKMVCLPVPPLPLSTCNQYPQPPAGVTERIVVLMLSCPATSCNEGFRVLSCLGQKSMTNSEQARIGMSLDFFPYLAILNLKNPKGFLTYAEVTRR